ncbi:MAG: formyltransferase family protein [Balneolaceae bacterium]
MNILLVADEATGLQAAIRILNSHHNLTAILTQPDSTTGLNMSRLARNAGVEVFPSSRVSNPHFATWMTTHNVDVLLNVHSLHLICKGVIQSLNVGAFNLHPGPLPQYAGLNAPSWAIYNQEKTHAVTLHEITSVIDAGDILYETTFPLTETDTGRSVSLACSHHGIKLVDQFLQDLSEGSNLPNRKAQDLSHRRIYKRATIPNHGNIQWSQTAKEISAFVRASYYSPFVSPWGIPQTRFLDHIISIFALEISTIPSNKPPGTIDCSENGTISVATRDQWVILTSWLLDGKTLSDRPPFQKGDQLQ